MKRINKILAACLKDIEAGSATLEQCLERHREVSRELEPLLRLVLDIEKLPAVAPSAVFKARARANAVAYAREHPLRHSPWQWMADLFVQPGWARAGVIVLAVVVVIAGAGTGTAYASQSSLPGDFLYPVKIGTESLREWIETNALGDVSLQIEFAGRRIYEMEKLILESSPDVAVAVSGYESNLDKAIDYVLDAPAAAESFALAVVEQLDRLDSLEDVSGGAVGIVEAEQIAVNRHIRALRYLSENSPVQAAEMTLASMRTRLERAAGAVSIGNTVRAENSLRLFNCYAGLGEEIRDYSAGTEFETPVEALFRQAVQEQERLFTSFTAHVSPQVAGEVQTAFQRMERQQGQDNGSGQPDPGAQGEDFGGQGEAPGNPGEAPGNPGETPGNPGETPGNPGEAPGSQGQEPDNQGQGAGSDNGGGSGSGMPPVE